MNIENQSPATLSRAGQVEQPYADKVVVDPSDGLVHRLELLLRGRWKWVIGLASVLAVAGAVGGWLGGQRMYSSRGQIYITPVQDDYGFGTGRDQSGDGQNYEAFVDMQMQLIKSPRVIDQAMENEMWRSLNRGISEQKTQAFTNNVQVSRKGDIITVEMRDIDPNAAIAGARSIIEAYQRVTNDENSQKGQAKLEFFQAEQARSMSRLSELDNEMKVRLHSQKGCENCSVEDLPVMFAIQLQSVHDIEKQLEEVRRELEVRGVNLKAATSQPAEPARASIEVPAIQRDRMEVERLTRLEAALVDSVTAAHAQFDSLAKMKRDIEGLREQVEAEKQNRDDIKKRIETQERLSRIPGRISVLAPAEKPLDPSDTRPICAAAGGVGGIAGGLGLVLLTSLVDRRVRGPHDARRLGLYQRPVLGVLPQLPEDVIDPEKALLAAHCVHQIRTLLQLWYGGISRPVLAVTGPEARTGKTSLTLALGVSYAAARSKTLLIDMDLVGGGLTQRVNAIRRRRIGQILRQGGVVMSDQLEEALTLAAASGAMLGETLIRLGYLAESDVAAALMTQQEQTLGVLDALEGEALQECVFQTEVSNLFILPLGSAGRHHVSRISPLGIQRLLDLARAEYDVVLVDTGPVPGSLEGCAVAAAVDGVVLTVSRGDQRNKTQQCVRYLHSIGAKMAGVVFNRVTDRDAQFGGRSSSAATSRGNAGQSLDLPESKIPSARFGPFGQVVVMASQEEGTHAR